MKNIVVLVSGGGTNLQSILNAQENGIIKNGKVTCVISSNENAYALQRAKNNNIDTAIIKKSDYSNFEKYDEKLTELLISKKADLIVLAGFMTILGSKIINQFKNKIINIHPSLIPSFAGEGYYGLKVHEEALNKGVKITGATSHFVNEECDGGPIILQQCVKVLKDDTPKTLQKRVMEEAEWIILPKTIQLFCQDKIKVVSNNKTIIL